LRKARLENGVLQGVDIAGKHRFKRNVITFLTAQWHRKKLVAMRSMEIYGGCVMVPAPKGNG